MWKLLKAVGGISLKTTLTVLLHRSFGCTNVPVGFCSELEQGTDGAFAEKWVHHLFCLAPFSDLPHQTHHVRAGQEWTAGCGRTSSQSCHFYISWNLGGKVKAASRIRLRSLSLVEWKTRKMEQGVHGLVQRWWDAPGSSCLHVVVSSYLPLEQRRWLSMNSGCSSGQTQLILSHDSDVSE